MRLEDCHVCKNTGVWWHEKQGGGIVSHPCPFCKFGVFEWDVKTMTLRQTDDVS